MFIKQYLTPALCAVILMHALPVYASGIRVSDTETVTITCSECDEICADGVEGESIKSLNDWVCQQCLKLCQSKQHEQSDSFKGHTVQPCPAKPVS